MPSGVQYSPVAVNPAIPSNILLAYIQNLLVAYCIQKGITMPSGPQYSAVGVSPALPDNILLAYIQNLLVALVGGGGSSSAGVQGGTKALVSGQTDGYTATFGVAFTSAPKIAFGAIKNSTNGANIFITGYTLTATGFSFDVSGDPGTGATLDYIATP